jgi:DNA-binding MarR family transcriptional regulator
MEIRQNLGILFHKIGAVMERYSDTLLFDAYGLGFSQFKLMYVLQMQSGMQQKEIALALGQTEASISRQIGLLKSAGMITVELGVDDKKKHLITLSTKGQQSVADAMLLLNEHYEPILSSLGSDEQMRLLAQLNTLLDNLEARCTYTLSSKQGTQL